VVGVYGRTDNDLLHSGRYNMEIKTEQKTVTKTKMVEVTETEQVVVLTLTGQEARDLRRLMFLIESPETYEKEAEAAVAVADKFWHVLADATTTWSLPASWKQED